MLRYFSFRKCYRIAFIVITIVIFTGCLVLAYQSTLKPELIRSPTWSPNNNLILSTCAFHAWLNEDLSYEICLIEADTERVVRLAPQFGFFEPLNPDWSPSGKKIAFERPRGGLIITDLQVGTTHIVTSLTCETPQWAPDEKKVACGQDGTVKLFDVEKKIFEDLTTAVLTPQADIHFLWDQTGTDIFFVRGYEVDLNWRYDLYRINVTTRKETKLIDNISASPIALSPSNFLLAFINLETTNLSVFDLSTDDPKPVLSLPTSCHLRSLANPQWSRNGQYVAFTAETIFSAEKQIYVIDTFSGNVLQQTSFNESFIYIDPPTWSNDDAKIATAINSNRDDAGWELYIETFINSKSIISECSVSSP